MGTLCPKAFAAGDETALAVPRLAPLGGDEVALPQPLAAPDAAMLRRLFAQPLLPIGSVVREGGLDRSVALTDAMLGHVLAGRYLHGSLRTATADLSAWLARYGGLADAAAIAAMMHRRDRGTVVPPRGAGEATAQGVPAMPPGDGVVRNRRLDQTLRQRLHDGAFDAARRLIDHTTGLAPVYAACLRAELAQALFTHNEDAAALALARRAVSDGGGAVGLAEYVAGLAAWRLGRPGEAGVHFAAAAQAPVATPALRAAGAYWAGRARLAAQDLVGWRGWMAFAAAQHRTFYGQIAGRALGRADGFAVAQAVLGEADIEAVAAEPAGLRAFALLQLGQAGPAEAELRLLARVVADRPGVVRAVMLVAERAGFYDFAAELAGLDGERIVVPRLRPGHGFMVDPALVYALTRIESNFDPAAVSAMGAQGLMQLMPGTADALGRRAARLHDPAVNLDLGQRYVAYLAEHAVVGGDLIRLLASYNAGPGGFGRWSAAIRDFGDPLLFIEAIPNDETRAFVQSALSYTWLYAAQLNLPAPSLQALAISRFPRFLGGRDGVKLVVLH